MNQSIQLDNFLTALENPNSNGILPFILGFLFMIMVSNSVLYYQLRSKVYLYYLLYIGFIILSSLFYVSSDFFDLFIDPIRPILFKFVSFFRWSYNLIYFLFAYKFVDLKTKNPYWNKIINVSVYSLFLIGIVVQIVSLITDDAQLMSDVFSRFFIPVIFLLSIFGYYVLFNIKAKFKEYLIVGSLFLIVTSMTGAALYYLDLLPHDNHLRDSIFYFGVVVENILFTLGLAHQHKNTLEKKNRIILEDKDKQLTLAVETQEYERARIAQEIHDGVLQKLGGVLLQVRNLIDNYNANNDENALDVIRNLESSNDELRDISHQMMPKSLKELGVVATVEDMLNMSLPFANIKHSFEAFNITERLSEKNELVLYRVAQELVNNIIKHSQANNVAVQIQKSNEAVVLMVEDDGIGISYKQQSTGIGLMNIRGRVEAMNGTLTFEQTEIPGTCVWIKLNL